MNKLTKTIAAVSFLAPLTAHSLGIGDIKLYSALNQKLNAEIALSLSPGEHIDDIKVNLATTDQFDKLGISWNYFISKVKFKPMVKPNGKIVIKMTSDQVLQEPILDFLVEVSWPNGELYKEFTVLVDPPVVYQQQSIPAPVVAPPVTRAKKKPVLVREPVAQIQNNFSSLAIPGEYGPTNRNDSLWKVAEKVNQHADISVEQMMMALYKANPGAFYKQNVNALMQGKSLKIPARVDILKLSKQQARQQFYRQMAIWEGKAVADPVVVQPKPVSVKPESRTEAPEIASDSSKLTLIPPSEEALSESVALANNSNETEKLTSENQQLQERLANLEKQFAIVQEMMAIKDQQLAAMQNQQLAKDPLAVRPLSQENNVDANKLEQQDNTQASQPVGSLPEQLTDKQQVTEKNTPDTKQAEADKQQPENNSGLNYYYLGSGIAVLLGFGWLLGRKRRVEEEINEISMFSAAHEQTATKSGDKISVPVIDNKAPYDGGTIGESSFLSEFTPGDFDIFETDQAEVDPSSEADVYLAYGRYQQAEELMRQAIADSPEKDEYKLKLLEVFYASENETDFEQYASELATAGKQTDINFWVKVSEMGSEIIPDSALFSRGNRESEATFEATDVASDDYLNAATSIAPDDVKSVTEVMSKMGSEITQSSGPDLDTSLTSRPIEETKGQDITGNAAKPNIAHDIENLDFDLSKFEPTDAHDEKLLDDLETFDFNSDAMGAAMAASEEASTASSAENDDFQFDFDFDDIPELQKPETTSPVKTDKIDSEVSDLTDMDELETKIDLAKAYIDMGDLDAARTIAQEVLEQGSDAQKLEAQAIINLLS
ncbi:FimV/HubP family polar landmark protein [Methyloprofundus sp.]|uniref:FimV/HubP family polar landmark protein n=1 Tax=Methyloprofundus sp. TaxID=2020875 RepID=UPI003D0BCD4A